MRCFKICGMRSEGSSVFPLRRIKWKRTVCVLICHGGGVVL